MKTLKIAACLLLLLQVFHLARLQSTTDSPGRTIDKSWLRELGKNFLGSENTAILEENEFDLGNDTSESSVDFSGTASGSNTEEEETVIGQDKSENETLDDLNISNKKISSNFENRTAIQPELPDAIKPSGNATTESTNSSQTNMTGTQEELNSTMTSENSSSVAGFSNKTVTQSTTTVPLSTTTQQSTTTPDADKRFANRTGVIDKSETTTSVPELNKTSTGSSTTTVFLPETTETSPSTETAVPNTPERTNRTGKLAGSDRGTVPDSDESLESDSYGRKRNVAWLAVLGTAAATACVGVVAYIILKKRHQKNFSHRKLVEEYPSEPVLRLDNCEPLDLNLGRSTYYNSGLQADDIQMENLPGRR